MNTGSRTGFTTPNKSLPHLPCLLSAFAMAIYYNIYHVYRLGFASQSADWDQILENLKATLKAN